MKIRNTLLLAGSLLLLGACDESKYDLDSLVPEQYHKILYVNNSGKQEVTLYDTGESYAGYRNFPTSSHTPFHR